MAINVNTVYTTVLSILNKEQRGYITPDEFNKLATQVQLDIFENYFEDYNQLLRIPQTDTEYVDRQKNINTAISIFKTFAKPTSVPIGAVLDLSITNAGTGYADNNNVSTTLAGSNNDLTLNIQTATPGFTISTPGTSYTNGIGLATVSGTTGNNDLTVNINSVSNTGAITGLTINQPGTGYTGGNEVLTITQAGSSGTGAITLTSQSVGAVASASVNALGSGYSVNDVVNINGGNANATATIKSINTDLYFLPPSNTHRIGTVIYKNKEVQRVDRNELLYLNLSPISKPSETFPVYLYEQATQGTAGSNTGQQHVLIYPQSITNVSDVDISYIRKPNNPMWGFTVGSLGQYIYNSSTSTQFELSSVEQTEVIIRILAYAGIVIKDPQIVQAASQAVQAEEINSKS